jgi:hypothetical protein
MTYPTTSQPSGAPIVSLCVALLAILVFVLSWRVSSFISTQNENLDASIRASRQQVEAGRPLDQNFQTFVSGLLQYLQATGDPNVVTIMNRYGLNVQIQPAQQGQQGQQPAPAAQPTRPATSPAPTAAPSSTAPPASPVR